MKYLKLILALMVTGALFVPASYAQHTCPLAATKIPLTCAFDASDKALNFSLNFPNSVDTLTVVCYFSPGMNNQKTDGVSAVISSPNPLEFTLLGGAQPTIVSGQSDVEMFTVSRLPNNNQAKIQFNLQNDRKSPPQSMNLSITCAAHR